MLKTDARGNEEFQKYKETKTVKPNNQYGGITEDTGKDTIYLTGGNRNSL